jgi:thiamine biosynthesis lipoprotein
VTVAAPVVEVAAPAMGTVFALQVADPAGRWDATALRDAADQALAIVAEVERVCSRFEPMSELAQLGRCAGEPIAVSPMLVELLALAVAMADASDGAFDPTLGDVMVRHGFDRHWRTDAPIAVPAAGPVASANANASARAGWRAITVDRANGTGHLARPLHLDLGALAKGFAADLVATAVPAELSCSVHAGGDVRCRGPHPDGRPWRIGVRDPIHTNALAAVAHIAEGAVCTSGDYERVNAKGEHHLLDPRTGTSAHGFRSVSVVAPTAVVADGLATAAFVLGEARAADWLAVQGVDALLIADGGTPTLVTGAGTTTWELLTAAPTP